MTLPSRWYISRWSPKCCHALTATPTWRPGCSAEVKWPHRFFTTGARAAGGGDGSHRGWTLLTMLLAPDDGTGLAPEENEPPLPQSLPLL